MTQLELFQRDYQSLQEHLSEHKNVAEDVGHKVATVDTHYQLYLWDDDVQDLHNEGEER
ncbi:MAG TPA: hypothetical protein VIR31_04465 [Nitrososphaeraceae archaeon]